MLPCLALTLPSLALTIPTSNLCTRMRAGPNRKAPTARPQPLTTPSTRIQKKPPPAARRHEPCAVQSPSSSLALGLIILLHLRNGRNFLLARPERSLGRPGCSSSVWGFGGYPKPSTPNPKGFGVCPKNGHPCSALGGSSHNNDNENHIHTINMILTKNCSHSHFTAQI